MKKLNKNGIIILISACIFLMLTGIIFYKSPAPLPKILTVGGKDFFVPSEIPAVINTLGYLSIRLDAATLQYSKYEDIFNDLEVDVLPASEHPGSFYLREKEIEKEKCKYKITETYKVCEYEKIHLGRPALDTKVYAFYDKDNALYLLGECNKRGKNELPNPMCAVWTPFLDNLKIAYNYPQIYDDKILEIDKAVKHILLNFYSNIQGKKNGISINRK